MSSLTAYASGTARDSAAPASSNPGLCIFRTDTKAIEVSDGTDYFTYNNDGQSLQFSSNSYSGVFDGAGDYVSIGTIASLNSSTDFTVTGWFNYDTLQTVIIGSGASTSARFAIRPQSTSSIQATVGSSLYTITLGISGGISSGTWYHFACVINGTSLTLYINGSASDGGSATVSSLSSGWADDFDIGRNSPNWTSNLRYFDGKLDEIAVYDSALTASDISNIYNSKIYIGPLALWRFENDTTDELGVFDGTNNGVTFSTTDKPY